MVLKEHDDISQLARIILQPRDTGTFVLLQHRVSVAHEKRTGRPDHYDLMIDPGGTSRLWTWSIDINLFAVDRQDAPLVCQTAIRLPDHRRRYLSFQGPLPGDRGTVKRLIQGTFQVISSGSRELKLQLQWLPNSPATTNRHNVMATGEMIFQLLTDGVNDDLASDQRWKITWKPPEYPRSPHRSK